MERWFGKVALVTGASAGIGAQICTDLLTKGMIVIGVARNVDKIRENVHVGENPNNLWPIKCDLMKEDEITDLFKQIRARYNRIDVCINNAGFSKESSLVSGSTDDWRSMLEVNVLALCMCTRESIKLMQENKVDDGQIIHISSMSAHRVVRKNTFYAGTKFMVKALTEGLRQELRSINSPIRIASISPGIVETEFLYRMLPPDRHHEADTLYGSLKCLQPSDISALVSNILSTPQHVEIHDILLRPTQQEL